MNVIPRPLIGLTPYCNSYLVKRWLSDSAKIKKNAIHEAYIREELAGELTEKTWRAVVALSVRELKPQFIWSRFISPGNADKDAVEKVHCTLTELIHKKAYDDLIELTTSIPDSELSGNPRNLLLFCKASIESNYYNPFQVYILMDQYIQKFGESVEALTLRGRAQRHRAEAAKKYAEMVESKVLNSDVFDDFNDCFPSKSSESWAEPMERYETCKKQSEMDFAKALVLEKPQNLVSSKD